MMQQTEDMNAGLSMHLDRCAVVCPRHDFIRPWIRAYFASGNTVPLLILTGPEGDWEGDDREYCEAAAAFSGGLVIDCSNEWREAEALEDRAQVEKLGWYAKKFLLHAVATRVAPKAWAWIDDDAEVMGNLDACFDYAESAPGFICAQFYYTPEIDRRHPDRMFRSDIDIADKICWNSFVLFHGEANERIKESLRKDFPVEDDECIFCHLYNTDPRWHEGFCDFSMRRWQVNCKVDEQIPKSFKCKILHYTSSVRDSEVKRNWAAKADILPKAPFEMKGSNMKTSVTGGNADDPVDAVFVIGTGSKNNNEELRYALRNIDRHCQFVRDVYICGECPQWVDKNKVKHLKWPDRFHHAKDANIIDKLRHACEAPGIAKRILFCSDDQFQTRECSWDDFFPRYLRRYSPDDRWYENKHRIWHTRLRKTLERDVQRRRQIGMDVNDVYYYQPHIWMPIDRDLFIDYARWCGYEQRDDTIIASGYFNFINAEAKPDTDHAFLGRGSRPTPDVLHIAYHDESYDAAMAILRKMFPERCRFELDPAAKPSHASDVRASARTEASAPSSRRNDADPSPATPEEMSEVNHVLEMVRSDPVWVGLLGEMSRAEEMRLFGVRGWRTVWRDIIERWRSCTKNGEEHVKVQVPRSPGASNVIMAYMSNPEALRTVRFGSHPQPPRGQPSKTIRQEQTQDNESMRRRVRESLRRIGK